MADLIPTSQETELRLALVRERYRGRLSPEELDGLRQAVEAIVDAARTLRAVPLANSDEPALWFRPET